MTSRNETGKMHRKGMNNMMIGLIIGIIVIILTITIFFKGGAIKQAIFRLFG